MTSRSEPTPLVPVRDEMLELSLALPHGWEVSAQRKQGMLVCVAGDDLRLHDFRPSITVRCEPRAEPSALLRFARDSLSDLQAGFEGFELAWSREDPEHHRVVRAYDFDPAGLGHRVRQVQGLVAGEQLVIVNCTRLLDGPPADEVFIAVIESTEPS